MANMNFGVNILPKTNNTYSLGNSDYKWNIYANTINGTEVDELTLPPVTSDDNNKILKVSEGEWTVGTAPSSLDLGETSTTAYRGDRGAAAYAAAVTNVDSTPTSESTHLLTSGGVYTALDDKAPKANPVFTGSISMGRVSNTTIGSGSVAEGTNTTASGAQSHAEGLSTTASGANSHAEGGGTTASGYQSHAEGGGATASGGNSHAEGASTIASGINSHAEGAQSTASGDQSHAEGTCTLATGAHSHASGIYNVADSYANWPEWVSGTSYEVGDKVKITTTSNNTTTIVGYICTTANTDTTFTPSNWQNQYGKMNYAEIVGNGTGTNARSNARALDWSGNEYLNGDLYINCNDNSTGGNKVISSADVMTGATSSANGASGLVPAPTTTDVDKFLAGDGTYKSGGLPMVILSYGSSTWAQFEAAYNNNVIVYARASSNSNPASGSQTRMAFMAYVNNATTPTEVEFQYYRSMSSHSATAMGDQVFVYKLTKTGGWSVTIRDASIKQIKVDTNDPGTVSWSGNIVTLKSGLPKVSSSDEGKILKVVNGVWTAVSPD